MNPASPVKAIKGQPVKKEESDPENRAVQRNIRIKRDRKRPLPPAIPVASQAALAWGNRNCRTPPGRGMSCKPAQSR